MMTDSIRAADAEARKIAEKKAVLIAHEKASAHAPDGGLEYDKVYRQVRREALEEIYKREFQKRTGVLEDLTDAEKQILSILRTDDAEHFTVEITREFNRWRVRLAEHETGKEGEGGGNSFEEAWADCALPDLKRPRGRRPTSHAGRCGSSL
jgi:hypothetical protein